MCLSFFFFSSRRRHTRSLCDWSSDVCSSDLIGVRAGALPSQSAVGEASDRAAVASDENRGVALTARAPDSKSGGWGFESLHPCHVLIRSEEHTSELQSHSDLVCRLLLEKKKT